MAKEERRENKDPRVILLNHIQALLHGAGYTVQYKGNWTDPDQDTLVVGRGANVFTLRVFHVFQHVAWPTSPQAESVRGCRGCSIRG